MAEDKCLDFNFNQDNGFGRQITFGSEDHHIYPQFEDQDKSVFNADAFGRQITGASEVPSTAADSTYQWAEASQTLIFLDWDDTLFPTTELIDRWGLQVPEQGCEQGCSVYLTQEQECCMNAWQEALLSYLHSACAVSKRVVIVTNAQPGWVERCVDSFAPKLKALLSREDGPHVTYASEAMKSRSKYMSSSCGGNPTKHSAKLSALELQDHLTRSKFLAMEQEAIEFYSQYPDQTWKNIISIGDAPYEHIAAQDLTFRRKGPNRESIRTKRIITPTEPPIRDMTYRLSVAALLWPVYVAYDGDIDVNMNSPAQLQAIVHALGMQELNPMIRSFPINESDQEASVEELDELAVLVQQRLMDWSIG